MHIEMRKRGRKKLYYLAHSFREIGRVRKIRRYLGSNLPKEEIEKLRIPAENAILERMEVYKKISDPFHTILSSKGMENIKTLIFKGDINIKHLSENDWKAFTKQFTYDTNAIEGSTVTAQEVRNIIEKNQWPDSRTKEEISETYGVAEAVDFLRKTREHISLELLKTLHNIVFRNSKAFAGTFRERGIEVAVIDAFGNVIHKGASQEKIVPLLKELIEWYNNNKNKYHPVVLAAVVHNQFENIHPFQDGNGRVGRLLMNNILLKHNMPPVNIEFSNRKEYYESLHVYEKKGDLRPAIELILKEYSRLRKSLK